MEDIKNLILEKAQKRFERFGYNKTSMDELSKDCKISKKTIYKHFHNKEDLFDKLIVRETNRIHQILFDNISGDSDPINKLAKIVKLESDFFNEDNFLTRLYKAEEPPFSVITKKKYQLMIESNIISIVSSIISEGKGQGMFRDVDEELVAYAGVRLVQVFSCMPIGELLPKNDRSENYEDVLIDFIVNAVVKK